METYYIKRKIEGRIYTTCIDVNDIISCKEASLLICVGLRHVYRLMDDSKKLKFIHIGKKRMIKCSEAIAYIKKRYGDERVI